MADVIIKKLTVPEVVPTKETPQIYTEEIAQPVQVRQFTINQLDAQIANYQARIDELEAKKATALAL